ncbi:MAG TPA: hypothetical protein VI248_15755 [Kineosporiaceae bacterium]
MPRRHLRVAGRRSENTPAPGGMQRIEAHPDGDWIVRRVSGAGADKTYRCPGCDHEVRPGTPHVVAWPADGPPGGLGDVSDRRHWHSPCWSARGRRRPRHG